MPGKMDSPTKVADDDEFSQGLILPPLVIQLRKILDQYSDDTQILKELIQNAEDAGATEVKFLYDKRQYGTDARYLHHPKLAGFQGPALYAYNDALFSEDDWKGIRMLSQSIKHTDPLKVGHFGIGFKSVFHLTDLPSILSGDRLGVIDPHQFAFTASSHGWNLSKRPDLLSTIPQQVESFVGTFNCESSTFRSGFYRGTLFRFPLRTAASPLASSAYSDDKMQALLEGFQADAHLLLLFLRNLERISVFERDKNSKTPRLLFRAEFSEDCVEEVKRRRRDFIAQIRSGEWQERPLVATYPVTICTESAGDKSTVKRRYRFLLTNYYCGGHVSPIFRNLFRDPELGYLPWVGTAMSLDDQESEAEESDGRLFCFLPLPVEASSTMGLPVHVHGFFALEQNRKYVKWPGLYSFSETHMDKGLLWNQCLLREAIPKAYINLLIDAIRLHSIHASVGVTVEHVYGALPNPAKVERKWEPVVSAVYAELLKHTMVYYESPETCEWIEAKNAVFNTLNSSDEVSTVITEILTVSNIKMVAVPGHVLAGVRKYAPFNLQQITPTLVATAYREVQLSIGLHWESKMKLLRYLLRQPKFELLDDLELLPLANGGFDVFHFNPKRADRPIYIVPSVELQALLPGLKDDFLEMDIDDDIKNMLIKAANRGYTQLKVLDASLVGKLLPQCLPSTWLNGRNNGQLATTNGQANGKVVGPVEWNPQEFGHPPAGWLESLWLFLIQHSSRDLNLVDGLPLLPSRTYEKSVGSEKQMVTELIALSSSNVCIARTMDGLNLSEDVEKIIRAIGITVIDDLPDYIKSHPQVLRTYVFAPNYLGVLRSIERRCVAEGRDAIVQRIADKTTTEQKRALRELFAKMSAYEVPRSCLELLTHLPLFETSSTTTVGNTDQRQSVFVSASSVCAAAPADRLPFRMSRPLLDTTTPDSQALGKLLGIKSLNLAQLLTQVIFPDIEAAYYDNMEVQSIMLYVLRHYHFFVDMDRAFRKTLRSLAFLPKADMLTTIDRFYDPDHELLQKLFLFEKNFPSGEYSEPSIVAVLREIGLRGVEDVDTEDLLESAFTIQQMYDSAAAGNTALIDQLAQKSDALLEYIHRHKSRLRANCSGTGKTLGAAMCDVRWLRALASRPTFYPLSVPWHGVANTFYRPADMVVRANINLVGSVRPVVIRAEVYAEVSKEFGWDKSPPLEETANHLSNVISAYEARDKVLFMEMSRNIYSELSRHDVTLVNSVLKSRQVLSEWVWHGDGFTRPDHVVITPPFMDLRPYVYSLPSEMSAFAEFFKNFGMSLTCDILQVLSIIKDKYCIELLSPATPGGSSRRQRKFPESEVKRDINMCVCVLNELKSHVTDDVTLTSLQQELFVPVHSDVKDCLQFARLSECSYCDDEWLRQGYSTSDLTSTTTDDIVTLLHPNVPASTAEALGVPTLMSKMLEAEELDYSFGQSDSLTHRLSTLLEEYSDGFAVPKELVQNADDAGATEVRFLYDERSNADAMTCLIDEGMKECHGPALWVYNNSAFTDEDFENITKLNGAMKEAQTDKIGRFGLGFNAVYNLTDVPSFVSRHCIVIFDPHTTYLGKSIRNKMKPGLKLDMRKHRRKLKSLSNQFKPFNDVFGCDLRPTAKQDCYPGTLFRLPLRTRAQSLRSEICQKHYDDAEMKALLRLLVNGAENLLLFTQNVLTVSVHHLPTWSTSPADMVEVFRITKKPVRIIRELNPIVVQLNDVYKGLDRETQHFIGQCSILRSATDVMRQVRKGVSVERLQFPDHSLIVRLEAGLTANGENLLTLQMRPGHQDWLVCGCMGKQESLKMALQEVHLLPTAGIAIPVESIPGSSSTYLPMALTDPGDNKTPLGAIFSYMPLPIRSGLPVHINGMFAVTSNRRSLCELNEDDKIDSRGALWNEILLRDAISTVYIRLLADLAALSPHTTYTKPSYELWPRTDCISSKCLQVLLRSFYRDISGIQGHKPAVFTDGRRWAGLDDTVLLDCPYTKDELNFSLLEVCRQCFMSSSTGVVVRLPDWLRQEFQQADVEHLLLARTYNEVEFFRKIFLPNIDMITQDDRDVLLINALTRNNAELNAVIKEFHCVPVTPDGTRLRQPTKLVDPVSQVAKLYLPNDARFPFGERTYARPDILEVLRRIGMKRSAQDLTWAEVIDRAHLLTGAKNRDAANQLAKIFLEILAEKLADNSTFVGLRQIQQQLLDVAFIPPAGKPQHFPLKWKSTELRDKFLFKPTEVFPPECRDLVGCCHCVADATAFPKESAELLSFLRLGMEWKEPTITQVIEQLDVLTNPDTENYLHDNQVLEEITRMCFKVCSFLQCKTESSMDRQTVTDLLMNRYFILGYSRFLSPKQLAFDFTQNCAPYLYPVPDNYRRQFTDLLKVAGVRTRFDVKDYVYSLQSMHDIYGSEPLDKDELRLALQLVSLLNEALDESRISMSDIVAKFGAIYVPNSKNILCSATELCYNEPDCQWVAAVDGTANSSIASIKSRAVSYSHPMIPYAISKQLGVNTQRQEVLKKHSRGIPFGQREPLTNRIKRILSGYPCDKEILKELLQNADDAGATEIQFIKDPRQHGTERIFDQSWSQLQGPALCVYNNRPFTEADLQGIQQLGQGSKSVDPNKTGQYGVGFNCVYHLTDAPSFMTRGTQIGETLCVFDPHAKYVPGATVEEPGRRYDDIAQLRPIFTDVFPCYLEDMFDLNNGTMFRFPLRTEQMAKDSDLSDQTITMDTVDQLFSKFRQEIFDCLLFVNNITTITMTEVNSRTKKLSNAYSVTVEMSDFDQSVRKDLFDHLHSVAKQIELGRMSMSEIPMKEVLYKITLTDTEGYNETWLISQRVGLDDGVKVPQCVIDSVRSKDLALLPRGGVAALLDTADGDGSRRPSRAFCFLPLPLKTDLPVHVNGHFALDHEARRNLWQDDDRGTKTEWNFLLFKEVIAPAYVMLLRRIPAYLSSSVLSDNISVMDSVGEEIPNLDAYNKLFPLLSKQTVPGYWRAMIESIYRRIHASQEIVLPVVRAYNDTGSTPLNTTLDTTACLQLEVEWISTGGDAASKPLFDNLTETFSRPSEDRHSLLGSVRRRRSRSASKKPPHELLRHVLLSCGLKIVRLPLSIFDSFIAAGVEIRCITPRSVIDFFALFRNGSSTCGLPSLPAELASTPFGTSIALKVVHDYCSQDVAYFRSNLSGLPLLLCEDGQLRQFAARDRVFLSSHHEVLPGLGSMFIHHSYVGTIFKEVDIESCDVFRRFDVVAFASLLTNVLPPGRYRWKTGQPPLKWNKESGEESVPNDRWLFLVWNFLREEFERVIGSQTASVIDETAVAKSVLEPLKDWCLIPAFTSQLNKSLQRLSLSSSPRGSSSVFEDTGEHFLVPLALADIVLDYSQTSFMSYPIRHCFSRVGIPELNCSLLDCSTTSSRKSLAPGPQSQVVPGASGFVRLLVSSLEQPLAVLKALQYLIVNQSVCLSAEECIVVLKYFADSIELWKDKAEAKKSLRGLPLHLTVHGNLMSLNGKKAHLLLDDMPQSGMEQWQKHASIVLLRSHPSLGQLYEVLDCALLSATELYSSFIFEEFELLPTDASLSHLQFIKDYKLPQLRGDEKEKFIASLSELAFLPSADGKLHRASEFFDPYHQVFKTMFKSSPDVFPPSPFCEFSWLDFLRLAGLQTELSCDLLVEFVQQIAKNAKTSGPSDELFKQSRTVVNHLFKMQNLPTLGVLERIVNIPFIPSCKPNSLMTKIHPSFAQSRDGTQSLPYIAFSEGIPEEHEVLVWTSAHLLPDWANPYKLTDHDVSINYPENHSLNTLDPYRREVARLLTVPENPPIHTVIDHVQNICGVSIGKSDDAQELRGYMKVDVMTRVYKYLQTQLVDGSSGLPRDEVQKLVHRLADLPCIVSELGQTFIRPRQLVISLYDDDQIYPYLNTMPTELGEFKRLFLFLGATMTATAEQYAMVLETMYLHTAGEKLHPNELRLAFKAVNGLFTTLKKHRHSDPMNRVHTLYLPTKIGHLFRSTEIVFNDEAGYADRIRCLGRPFLVDLNECWLVAENQEETVKLLPQRIRPAMLSSIVQEVLEDRSRDSLVLHTVADKLKYQINSRPFAQGLLRLIRHEHRRSGHRVRQSILDSIEQHLRKIHVYGVEKVVTYLSYDGQRLSDSETEGECFIDKKVDEDTQFETWNIYINKTMCLNEELQVAVAEVINRMTGFLLKNSVHYIQPILSCTPHSISKVLDRLKVRPDHSHSVSDGLQPTLPTPGTFVPIEDHHLLKEDFEEFEMGEYVGYELDDDESGMPIIIYAIILERIEEEEFVHVTKSDSEEHAAFTHRKFTQRYRINIGDDRQPTLALATDLYKFHRVDGFVSRGGSVGDQSGRRGSFGPVKSPKPNYRESFYRSSVFEPEETGTPTSKTWDKVPGDTFRSPGPATAENGDHFGNFDEQDTARQTRQGGVPQTNGDVPEYSSTLNDDDSGYTTRTQFGTSPSNHGGFTEFENIPEQPEYDEKMRSPQFGGQSTQDQADGQNVFEQPGNDEPEIITTDMVMNDVSDQLEEAWKLPEPQRKKIIKRLLLKWHPDKNIGNEEFATIIIQHIQAEIERLELGLPRPANFDSGEFDFDPRNPFTSSQSFQQNFASAYKFFFEQMNQRAKEHREQRERYQENFSREYSSGRAGEYNFDVPPTFSSVNPQPAQAKRFLRQAQEDLRAADNDYDAQDPAFEWACFKAHQAAEKALKAAQFAVDAVTSFSHDLVTLAASLEDIELRRLAQKLQKIVGNSNKLYNPDPIDFVVIPHEEYTREMACDAVMCAVDVLERVKEFVELRDTN